MKVIPIDIVSCGKEVIHILYFYMFQDYIYPHGQTDIQGIINPKDK